jgi:hypothetical protein
MGLKAKSQPTKRAADWWNLSPFSSIFLASGFSCSRSESRPAHQRLTQAVGRQPCVVKQESNVEKTTWDKWISNLHWISERILAKGGEVEGPELLPLAKKRTVTFLNNIFNQIF